MPFYENVFIARQDISSTQAEALTEQFANLIVEQGGKVTKKEQWGLRNIAYRINKNRKGHYVLMNIEATGPAISEMERQMRINEDILRYLTVRVALHPEVIVTITANVAKSEEEAEIQKKAGGFVPPTTEEDRSLEEVLAEADEAAAGEAEPAEAEPKAEEAAEAKPKRKAKAAKADEEPAAEKPKREKKAKAKKAESDD